MMFTKFGEQKKTITGWQWKGVMECRKRRTQWLPRPTLKCTIAIFADCGQGTTFFYLFYLYIYIFLLTLFFSSLFSKYFFLILLIFTHSRELCVHKEIHKIYEMKLAKIRVTILCHLADKIPKIKITKRINKKDKYKNDTERK